LVQWRVDRHLGAFVVMFEGLDLPLLVRNHFDAGAGVLQGLDRFGELDLLDAVSRQNCNGVAFEFSCQ
jgi:hypothetical protein